MPKVINGRALGVATNGIFTAANTDPIPGGELWTEAALTWKAMLADYVAHGGHPGDFVPTGPGASARSRGQQDYFWGIYQRNGRPVAAVPGTSNHGWAIAVDVKTKQAAAWIINNGHRYGWSHDEGLQVGEWWHMRYVGAPSSLLKKLQKDPLDGYTAAEKRWIHEFDQGPTSKRKAVLVRVMTEARKRIWQAAQDKPGWTKSRKKRYASLLARTT